MNQQDAIAPSRAEQVYERVRAGILGGAFEPEQVLSPANIAAVNGVSLAVAREALLRLVGEGLAVRIRNKGFVVPRAGADRWQEIAEARILIEPQALRLAVARGDLAWEAMVRATHHTLSRTGLGERATGRASDEWAAAHHAFHRSLIAGCGNSTLLDLFERLWDASELTRRWSDLAVPGRDFVGEHAALEQACLDRDGERAAALLAGHLMTTAAALTDAGGAVWASNDKKGA